MSPEGYTLGGDLGVPQGVPVSDPPVSNPPPFTGLCGNPQSPMDGWVGVGWLTQPTRPCRTACPVVPAGLAGDVFAGGG